MQTSRSTRRRWRRGARNESPHTVSTRDAIKPVMASRAGEHEHQGPRRAQSEALARAYVCAVRVGAGLATRRYRPAAGASIGPPVTTAALIPL